MEKTPCYMIVRFNGESAYLIDAPVWRWLHEGGTLPASQAGFITEDVLSEIDEELAEGYERERRWAEMPAALANALHEKEDAAHVRARHVNGVFGPRYSSAGDAQPMTVSAAIRYARERGLDLVDAVVLLDEDD